MGGVVPLSEEVGRGGGGSWLGPGLASAVIWSADAGRKCQCPVNTHIHIIYTDVDIL